MILIGQGLWIINRKAFNAAQLIEFCGRTCYKSEHLITDTSADKFAHMISGKRHFSVIEHGYMILEVAPWMYSEFYGVPEHTKYLNMTNYGGRCIVSGNLRAWVEFVQAVENKDDISVFNGNIAEGIKAHIQHYCYPVYDAVFGENKPYEIEANTRRIYSVDVDELSPEEREVHEPVTAKFVTNRSVTHELVRHRPGSVSQESTRYVNYGGTEMQFIKPVWWNDELWEAYTKDRAIDVDGKKLIQRPNMASDTSKELYAMITFFESCCSAEAKYNQLLKFGWRAEQAREVLPNALKTEIVVTATKKQWRHIIELRTSSAAHPQIRSLIEPLKEIIV